MTLILTNRGSGSLNVESIQVAGHPVIQGMIVLDGSVTIAPGRSVSVSVVNGVEFYACPWGVDAEDVTIVISINYTDGSSVHGDTVDAETTMPCTHAFDGCNASYPPSIQVQEI